MQAKKEPQRANIISEETGSILGGPVVTDHGTGIVTINFAGGLAVRGRSLTHEDVLAIEAGRWTGEPKLKAQRV